MEPYTLYIQVGSNSKNAEWLDAGPLNVATMVTVNGQYQNTWDADTKLDKVSTQTPNNQVYVKSYNGTQSMVDISQVPNAWKIASYNGEGQLKTNAPTADNDCVNKGYADTKLDKIPLSQASGTIAYCRDHLGNESYRGVSASANGGGGAIPVYNRAKGSNNGILKTSTPEEDADCVNKGYADANYGPVTITVEDQITAWDDGDYFSILDSYYYTIHTFATYLYEGHAYTINFKPVSMFTGDDSWAMAEVNFLPGYNNLPGFTDEMLKQIQVSYHYTTNTPEICNYWLREPEAGYPDGVSGLTLTVIIERLY